jgi:hypothetical protein
VPTSTLSCRQSASSSCNDPSPVQLDVLLAADDFLLVAVKVQATIARSKTRSIMPLFFFPLLNTPGVSFRGWLQARDFFSLDVHIIQVWHVHADVYVFQFIARQYTH